MNLRPHDDRVIIEPAPAEEVTVYGIIIPEQAQEKPQRGTVVAAGRGQRLRSGKYAAPELMAGDEVLYTKYGGTEVEHEGQKLLVLHEQDVIARIVG